MAANGRGRLEAARPREVRRRRDPAQNAVGASFRGVSLGMVPVKLGKTLWPRACRTGGSRTLRGFQTPAAHAPNSRHTSSEGTSDT